MKIQIHESLAPLLRGIGLTVVLLGTVLAAVQARETESANAPAHPGDSGAKLSEVSSSNSLKAESIDRLTREIGELRESVQEESTVGEVLTNRWFGTLGTIGTAITASSFYVEWFCKRRQPVSQNPS